MNISLRNRTGLRLALGTSLALAAGCDDTDNPEFTPAPIPPHTTPGMATLQGRVLTLDQRPIADASVTVLETLARATTDAEGRWQLAIAPRTTIALRGEAPGFGPTLRGALAVLEGHSSAGVDLALATAARMEELRTLGKQPAGSGARSQFA